MSAAGFGWWRKEHVGRRAEPPSGSGSAANAMTDHSVSELGGTVELLAHSP